jgi:uncharacterized protein (DUF1330 family)
MEFPNRAAADGWYNSPEYQKMELVELGQTNLRDLEVE